MHRGTRGGQIGQRVDRPEIVDHAVVAGNDHVDAGSVELAGIGFGLMKPGSTPSVPAGRTMVSFRGLPSTLIVFSLMSAGASLATSGQCHVRYSGGNGAGDDGLDDFYDMAFAHAKIDIIRATKLLQVAPDRCGVLNLEVLVESASGSDVSFSSPTC